MGSQREDHFDTQQASEQGNLASSTSVVDAPVG